MTRLVVLGAKGFIGRALCARAKSEALAVLAFGSADHDLLDASTWEGLSAALHPSDTVVMLAALTPRRGRDPATLGKNVCMARTVCRALEEAGCQHVVYVSSDAVYGYSDAPVSESSPTAWNSLYATMHLVRESMFAKSCGDRLLVVRPTQIYGTGEPHDSYGPNRMLKQALARGEIEIFGYGEEFRDHISIDDFVDVIMALLARRTTGILNVVSGYSVRFAEIATMIQRLAAPGCVVRNERRAVPITHRHFDVTQLRRAVAGFAPLPLESGVKRLFENETVTTTTRKMGSPVAPRDKS